MIIVTLFKEEAELDKSSLPRGPQTVKKIGKNFWGRVWNLIDSYPDLCLFNYFVQFIIEKRPKWFISSLEPLGLLVSL